MQRLELNITPENKSITAGGEEGGESVDIFVCMCLFACMWACRRVYMQNMTSFESTYMYEIIISPWTYLSHFTCSPVNLTQCVSNKCT